MCQITCLEELGNYSRFDRLLEDFRWKLRFIKRRAIALKNKFTPSHPTQEKTTGITLQSYKLEPGDTVKIRSKGELQKLVAGRKQYKGCPFIEEMYDYGGKTYRVLKVVDYFYDEVKRKLCKCKNLVILEDVVCSGKKRLYLERCELNCFFFWHTDLLEKV